jgi:hypothetical protein
MVQARVTDDQYDYLEHLAVEGYDGDLSAARRACIINARFFERLADSPDPTRELSRTRSSMLSRLARLKRRQSWRRLSQKSQLRWKHLSGGGGNRTRARFPPRGRTYGE